MLFLAASKHTWRCLTWWFAKPFSGSWIFSIFTQEGVSVPDLWEQCPADLSAVLGICPLKLFPLVFLHLQAISQFLHPSHSNPDFQLPHMGSSGLVNQQKPTLTQVLQGQFDPKCDFGYMGHNCLSPDLRQLPGSKIRDCPHSSACWTTQC